MAPSAPFDPPDDRDRAQEPSPPQGNSLLEERMWIEEDEPTLETLIEAYEESEELLIFLYGGKEDEFVGFGQEQLATLPPEYRIWLRTYLLDRDRSQPKGTAHISLGSFFGEHLESIGVTEDNAERRLALKEIQMKLLDGLEFPPDFPPIRNALQLTPAMLTDLGYAVSDIFYLLSVLGGTDLNEGNMARRGITERIRRKTREMRIAEAEAARLAALEGEHDEAQGGPVAEQKAAA